MFYPHQVDKLFALIRCLGFMVALSLSSAQAQTEPLHPVALLLEKDKPIEAELKGGQEHTYQIKMLKGQYFHTLVEQKGIDLTIALIDTKGEKLLEANYFSTLKGTERIFAIAETEGVYQLKVRTVLKEAPLGSYQIKLLELRAATEQDQNHITAQKLTYEGATIYLQGGTQSLAKAIEKYESAIVLWNLTGNKELEAVLRSNIGTFYLTVGERQKASDAINRSLELAQQLKNQQLEAIALNTKAIFYGSGGDLKQALEHLKQALVIWQQIKDLKGEANTLSNMGGFYTLTGDYQQSLEALSQVVKILHTLGDEKAEAGALNNMGNAYNSLGDYQGALSYYNQALPIKHRLGDRRGEAYLLNNIGLAYNALGEYNRGLEYLNQSLPLARELSERRSEGSTLNNIGDAYDKLHEYQKAVDYYNQALVVKRAIADRTSETVTLNNLGKVYSQLKEYDKAQENYQQANSISKELKDLTNQAQAGYGLALVAREKTNLLEAEKEIAGTIKIVESLRANVVVQELRSSYLASTRNYYEFYIDLLMRLHKQNPTKGYDGQALQVAERAIARSLLDTLNESHTDIKQGIPTNLLAQEHTLREKLNDKANLQARLLKGKYTPEQAETIAQDIDKLTNEYQQLQAQLRIASPSYASLSQPIPLSAPEIQHQVLDNNSILLEYILGEEQSYLWVVSASTITSYQLPAREEIERVARNFYNLLTIKNQKQAKLSVNERRALIVQMEKEYPNAAEELGHILLPMPKLEDKRLLIVADGILHYLPFAALISTETKQPLITEHEIINLPSASTLAIIRREAEKVKVGTKSVIVLADPVFSKKDIRCQTIAKNGVKESNSSLIATRSADEYLEKATRDVELVSNEAELVRLLSTKDEAEAITNLVAPNERKIAVGFEANKALAISTELQQYRFIHFATHGLLNSTHPELSGIVLSLINEQGEAQDGFLKLSDIYNLNLPADLVVLSACQTGLGKEIKGEGMVGLARGFMHAGASRIVASLWKVDDEATAELMRYFYKAMLKDGLKPSAALRSAQLMMLKQKQRQSPFYWAAFTIQGEYK